MWAVRIPRGWVMSRAVSIVTVCLNDARGLERTIESVRQQSFVDRELIVVDGGSADGSVDVLRRSGDTVTSWTSRSDGGVFDGQNEGARRARGEWLVFLNAGDTFAQPDALRLMMEHADGVDVVYGDAIWEKPTGERWVSAQPDPLTLEFFMRTALPHQATAVRRRRFEELGPFDTTFQVAADHAFFLKAIVIHGVRTRHVAAPVAVQLFGGRSTSGEWYPTLRLERQRAKEEILSPVLLQNWEQYLRASQGPVSYFVRTMLRPYARRLRGVSRRIRNKPDCHV
jgi:glycosyltransferase involved in cell wall biosynthesis